MLVTVIIPSYNHKQYIIQAIESVLDQNWPHIDLIVIDDGSKDGSPEMLREYLKINGGFRLVTRENRGLISTLNEGMDLARGETVCFLASDDYLPPGSIAARARFLCDCPDYIAVFGDALMVNGNEVTSDRFMNEKLKQLFSISDPVPEFLRGVNLPVHTLMARREAFRAIGGFDPRYIFCEDLDVQLLLFLQGPVGFVDVPVYCYRRHETNISLTNRQIARADKVLCFRKYLEEIPALEPYRKLIRKRLRRHYLALGRYLRSTDGATLREKEVFDGGWEFAWRDIRLLWHLLCWEIGRKVKSKNNESPAC